MVRGQGLWECTSGNWYSGRGEGPIRGDEEAAKVGLSGVTRVWSLPPSERFFFLQHEQVHIRNGRSATDGRAGNYPPQLPKLAVAVGHTHNNRVVIGGYLFLGNLFMLSSLLSTVSSSNQVLEFYNKDKTLVNIYVERKGNV